MRFDSIKYRAALVALLGSGLLAAETTARIVSVNLAFSSTGNTAIEGPESFGVPELETVVGNWNNLNSAGGLVRDNGQSGQATVIFEAPGGYSYFGAGYINTPLNYGIQQFAATPAPATIELSNLAEEFPTGYYAIVYLTGFIGNTGASISNGGQTYYYQTLNPVPATFAPEDLVHTTMDAAPAVGAAPTAQYAVFGSPEAPLTADVARFELRVLSGGGAGLGGVQIVAAAPIDDAGDGREEATFTDPSHGDFFLDAENGDDGNAGRSPQAAWKSLSRLQSARFAPGDVILFRAGDVFTGSFYLVDSGTPEQPIVLGAYGTGTKPRLEGGPNDPEVILLTNNGGLEFRDLEISNYYPAGTIATRFGIRIVAPPRAGDIRHLHFHRMDFTWIKGSGSDHESRAIDGKTTTNDEAVPPTRWNGFVVENCYFYQIDGRAVQVNDRSLSIADKIIRSTEYYPTIGFVFQNNVGRDIYRNMLQLAGTKDAVIQHNYMSGTKEGSAFWPFDTDGTLVQFNDFRHLRNENADSYICHFDYNCIDTVMQYNFGYDVDGGLIEVIVLSDFAFFQERAIARYNIGIDVGFRDKENSAGIFLTGRVIDSQIYNNTVVTTDLHSAYKAISVRNWGGEWPLNNYVYNNLFLANGSPSTFNNIERIGQAGNILSHNLYYGNITAPTEDRSPVTGNPLIANPDGLDPTDMKLTAGSAAIAAGRMIENNGGRDFFDNPLPEGLIPSIGAHEFQTEGVGRWAGIKIDDNGLIDSGGAFLGWLSVESASTGWVYSYALSEWVYAPQEQVVIGEGGWCYFVEIAVTDPQRAIGQWFYSVSLGTWIWTPESAATSGAGWGYVIDLSVQP